MTAIKYKIPRVTFTEPQTTYSQWVLEVKPYGAPDTEYELVTANLTISANGNVASDIAMELEEDTQYTLRLTPALGGGGSITKSFRTSINLALGSNPLYMKKVYAGQQLSIFDSGFLSSTLPTEYSGWFYTLDGNYRDAYGGFGNLIPHGNAWDVLNNPLPSVVKRRGFKFGEGRYLNLNNEHPNISSRINMESMFGQHGDKDFCLYVGFYVKYISGGYDYILDGGTNDDRISIYIDPSGVVRCSIVSSDGDGGATSYAERALNSGDLNTWIVLGMEMDMGTPANNKITLYKEGGNINFLHAQDISVTPIGNSADTIYIGRNIEDDSYAGENIVINRLYFAGGKENLGGVNSTDRAKLTDPESAMPVLHFIDDEDEDHPVPVANIMKLDDSVMTVIIPNEIPEGDYDMYVTTWVSERDHTSVEVVKFDKEEDGFDIDFENDFDNALVKFKEVFAAFHSQWGGQNGGCSGDLIYANRNRSLTFEQHGDNYDGVVQGVGKVAMIPGYTGYGIPKIHELEEDPKYGQEWKTRVGSVAVTKGYYGFGEWSTWMKIPVDAKGFAPALWFFHYEEHYPGNPLWDYWQNRGLHPYGGADPYLVVNHEIDIELPSHLYQGTFASWAELQAAFWDVDKLDTQYHVLVDDLSLAYNHADVGLFRLNNPSAPAVKASWRKVEGFTENRTIAEMYNVPSYKNIKFNNWIGEKSSGNGWAYEEEGYEGEEYLSLLTRVDPTNNHDYADGEFHKYTIKWYKDRTELWVDDVLCRVNMGFVPFIPARMTMGGWFPSGVSGSSLTPWVYTPARAWAGYPANWKTMNLEIKRVSFRPYDSVEAGGVNEIGDTVDGTYHSFGESYPESGLRSFA